MSIDLIAFFIGGLVLGLYGGTLGQGSGVLGLPLLVDFFHKEFALARAVCLMCNVPISCSAVFRHRREGRSFEGLLPVVMGIVFGVFMGVLIKDVSSEKTLWTIYCLFLVIVFFSFFLKRSLNSDQKLDPKPWAAFMVGIAGGVFCGAIGVGGGALMVPGLALFAHIPLKRCFILSNATIIIGSLFGLCFNWVSEAVMITLAMVPGLILGAYFGANLGQKLPDKVLKTVFSIVILSVLIKVSLKIGFI